MPPPDDAPQELDAQGKTPFQSPLSQEEVDALVRDLNEYKDKYLRLLAEWENGKKHLQKEKSEISKHAIERTLLDFLAPLDQFENALRFSQSGSTPPEVKNWAIGFQMILTQFQEALLQNGAAPFDSKGKSFDPYLHDAVEVIETADHPPGVVLEECVRGYKMGDRIIRPARVKVTKALRLNAAQ